MLPKIEKLQLISTHVLIEELLSRVDGAILCVTRTRKNEQDTYIYRHKGNYATIMGLSLLMKIYMKKDYEKNVKDISGDDF